MGGQPPNYAEVMTYATDAWNPAKIGKAPDSAEWRAPIQVATTQADTPPVRGQFRRTSGDLDLLAFGFTWAEVLKGNTPEWELTDEEYSEVKKVFGQLGRHVPIEIKLFTDGRDLERDLLKHSFQSSENWRKKSQYYAPNAWKFIQTVHAIWKRNTDERNDSESDSVDLWLAENIEFADASDYKTEVKYKNVNGKQVKYVEGKQCDSALIIYKKVEAAKAIHLMESARSDLHPRSAFNLMSKLQLVCQRSGENPPRLKWMLDVLKARYLRKTITPDASKEVLLKNYLNAMLVAFDIFEHIQAVCRYHHNNFIDSFLKNLLAKPLWWHHRYEQECAKLINFDESARNIAKFADIVYTGTKDATLNEIWNNLKKSNAVAKFEVDSLNLVALVRNKFQAEKNARQLSLAAATATAVAIATAGAGDSDEDVGFNEPNDIEDEYEMNDVEDSAARIARLRDEHRAKHVASTIRDSCILQVRPKDGAGWATVYSSEFVQYRFGQLSNSECVWHMYDAGLDAVPNTPERQNAATCPCLGDNPVIKLFYEAACAAASTPFDICIMPDSKCKSNGPLFRQSLSSAARSKVDDLAINFNEDSYIEATGQKRGKLHLKETVNFSATGV